MCRGGLVYQNREYVNELTRQYHVGSFYENFVRSARH